LLASAGAARECSATALGVKASGTKTFYLNDRVGANQVTFFSESTVEDFTGVCNKIAGTCTIDPKNIESLRGSFSLRVTDMSTGIPLRDTHLRSADWLDAQRFPTITIEVANVKDVQVTRPDTAKLVLVVKCTLHGITHELAIPATLTYLDESPTTQKRAAGDLLRIRAEFPVKLSEFEVKGPAGSDVIGLKVADEIQVKVSAYASTTPPPPESAVDRPGQGEPGAAPPPPDKPATQPAPAPPQRP
jgi:polyisoprenoid-binding protein YceI